MQEYKDVRQASMWIHVPAIEKGLPRSQVQEVLHLKYNTLRIYDLYLLNQRRTISQ